MTKQGEAWASDSPPPAPTFAQGSKHPGVESVSLRAARGRCGPRQPGALRGPGGGRGAAAGRGRREDRGTSAGRWLAGSVRRRRRERRERAARGFAFPGPPPPHAARTMVARWGARGGKAT